MNPKIRIGLIVGAVGLVLNIIVAAVMGLCGPFVALLAGAIAGFLAAQQTAPASKGDGARDGAIAGGVAGALVFVGQIIGGVLVLFLIQNTDITPVIGSVPEATAPGQNQLLYYLAGLGTGTCFGIVGIAASALGGAAGGYLGTSNSSVPADQDEVQSSQDWDFPTA
jgi:hypothetical protein